MPLPEELRNEEKLDIKVCQQYALPAFAENIVLIDTGHAKLMSPFFNLEKLRMVPGFESAVIVDPYSGGKGNSIRYLSVAPRDNYMRAKGMSNLFNKDKTTLNTIHFKVVYVIYLIIYFNFLLIY